MAQADSVPSSTRQLITGESASQSTNLPAVRIKPCDRGYFIGDLGARSIIRAGEAPALPHHCRENRGGIEPDGLFNRRWCEANAGWVPAGSNIGTLSDACRLLWNVLLIVFRFLSRNKRLQVSASQNAVVKVSSNQLVRSRPQERLK